MSGAAISPLNSPEVFSMCLLEGPLLRWIPVKLFELSHMVAPLLLQSHTSFAVRRGDVE